MVSFEVSQNDTARVVTPEEVGYYVIWELIAAAERKLSARVARVVMSVPAEFDDLQRNYTMKAGHLAGNRIILLFDGFYAICVMLYLTSLIISLTI